MRFLRTANAGGLITLDGVRILMDGVCGLHAPYLQTPAHLQEYLQEKVPDAVGFTHRHPDHFHSGYQDLCLKSGTTMIAPDQDVKVDAVTVTPIKTRHLGKVEPDLQHNSFLICGSKRILFAGDAAPTELKNIENIDVLIAPYAWVTSVSGRKSLRETGARTLILVHLPGVDPDPFGIWEGVRSGLNDCKEITVFIPDMGEEVFVS